MSSNLPSTSVLLDNDKIIPGPKSTRLIKRILRKLTEECNSNAIQFQNPVQRACNYTGLHEAFITKLKFTLPEVIEDKIHRLPIYNTILKNILGSGITLTTWQLFMALDVNIPIHTDIETFRRALIKHGFVWVKGSPVIIEKPSVVNERYNYLKQLIEYKSVFYVEKSVIDVQNRYRTYSDDIPKSEILHHLIYVVYNQHIYLATELSGFTEETYKKWMINTLLNFIGESSVIVVKNCSPHNEVLYETPTAMSVKADIIDWLDRHNVPYDESLAKWELYYLAEKYTDMTKKTVYVVDEIFKGYGHKILRLPESISHLSPASKMTNVLKRVRHEDCGLSILEYYKKRFKESLFTKMSKIEEEAQVMFENDLKVDQNLDAAIQAAISKVSREDSDYPSSDSD